MSLLRKKAESLLASPFSGLLAAADAAREKTFGDGIELCAIINIRNGACGMDCKFCRQSSHYPGGGEAYPLLSDESLKKEVERLASWPVAHIGLVASGAALSGLEFERLLAFIASRPAAIRQKLCASLGRLSQHQLRALRKAGLKRYHHNIESSENFYPKICSTQKWRDRLECAAKALSEDLELCCGGLFGMGESWKDRIDLALSIAGLGADSVPINFLQPRPGTPLARRPLLDKTEAARILALFRLLLPHTSLRVCGGRPAVFGGNGELMFRAGANALMTGNYLTTQGQGPEKDLDMLARAGLRAERSE